MFTKETIHKKIDNNLSMIFVDNYKAVNDARTLINSYLGGIGVNYKYDNYNDFCMDFMNNSKELVNNISEEELNELNNSTFVIEVLSVMIKDKINTTISDEKERGNLISQHNLQKTLLKL